MSVGVSQFKASLRAARLSLQAGYLRLAQTCCKKGQIKVEGFVFTYVAPSFTK